MLELLTLILLSAAQEAPPPCRYDDVSTLHTDYGDWQRSLLDPIYKLDADYAPPDLVSAAGANLAADKQVRALMLEDLRALVLAAEAAGVPLELQSAYRSYSYQERTFAYWTERNGAAEALKTSARAGHSEHQLGTALDFRSAGGPAPWDLNDWAETPAGAWLAANAWRYGFVMSYPPGKTELTCYSYEPWHYRYVGPEAARAVVESGLSLREWLWHQQ